MLVNKTKNNNGNITEIQVKEKNYANTNKMVQLQHSSNQGVKIS